APGPAGRAGQTRRNSSRAPPSRPAPRIAVPNGGGRADPSPLSPEVNVMGKSFRSRPQLEVLEDRLPPGGLHGGLSPIGAGAQAAGQLGHALNRQVLWDTATGQAAASAAQDGRGGEVLPAAARPHGFSLTDMARATALFNTSGNDLSQYPQTPFQILYVDPTTETFNFVNCGLGVTGTNPLTPPAAPTV